jgi:hypothetical protein
MKFIRRIESWAVLAGVAVAASALAQPEQWLQYHTSPEGQGHRFLELTTNAPDGVTLPKLNPPVYFARWTTPLDPSGGRCICLERSRKAGLWDRLYIDSNGNGRLDDKTPLEARRRDQNSAYFDAARVVLQTEDGPVAYHLVFQFMKHPDGSAHLLAESGGWYAGTVDFAGKKRRVQLIDANVNGTFNDTATSPDEADRIAIEGEEGEQRCLGRWLELDNQLFQIEVARDGAFVKVKKAENVALGQVRVPTEVSQFTAVGENGQFTRKPDKGEFTLPVGKYQVYGWSLARKDDKGATWRLSGYSFPASATFEVAAGKTNSLQLGEPIRVAFEAAEQTNRVNFSLRLLGTLGESVELMRGDRRPRAPKLFLASRDGSYFFTNNFTYG